MEPHKDSMRLSFLGRLGELVSHEIRNPLNALFLHLDIVEEELHRLSLGDRTQIDESLATIKMEVVRLHDLIQDYLCLARLPDVRREPEDVRTFLEGIAREVQEQLAKRGILLQLEGLNDLGEMGLHRSSLHRALVKLVQQAMEAMPQGGSLTLRAWRTPAHMHLGVHYTGESLHAKAVLQGLSSMQTTVLDRANLGLYVAQEIVTAHGGALEVSSEAGKGTTFTMTLPLEAREPTI